MDFKTLSDRLDNDFMHHVPKGDQGERYSKIRAAGKTMALLIKDLAPEGREFSLALTKIDEAVFWANAAIARNE